MHGWWWPGRQVVVVLPCVVLAIAWWVTNYVRARVWLAVAALIGLFSFVWYGVEGLVGNRRIVTGVLHTTNPWYEVWRVVLPDDRVQPAGTLLLRAPVARHRRAPRALGLAIGARRWRDTPPSDPSRTIEQENHAMRTSFRARGVAVAALALVLVAAA